MKYVWAKNIASGVYVADISATNMLPDGCERYFTEDKFLAHESGAPLFCDDSQGVHRLRTEQEIHADAKYKTWWNAKVEEQLKALDIKRIRPSAEINDDNITAQEKQAAKASLKNLNIQAAELRGQLIP